MIRETTREKWLEATSSVYSYWEVNDPLSMVDICVSYYWINTREYSTRYCIGITYCLDDNYTYVGLMRRQAIDDVIYLRAENDLREIPPQILADLIDEHLSLPEVTRVLREGDWKLEN